MSFGWNVTTSVFSSYKRGINELHKALSLFSYLARGFSVQAHRAHTQSAHEKSGWNDACILAEINLTGIG